PTNGRTCPRATTRWRCGTRNWVSRPPWCIFRPTATKLSISHIGEVMSRNCWISCSLLTTILLAGCGASKPPAGAYKIFVTNEASGDLTVIDPVKMEALGTIPLGKRARGIHPSNDGKLLYVALSGSPLAPPGVDESTLPPPDKSADGIGIFDIAQNKMLRKVPGGSDPEQFAVSRDGKVLYVSNEDAAGLSFVDPSNGNVSKTLPTGEEPEGVMMSPDAKLVFVTSENDGTVAVVDLATEQVTKKIQVGRRPRGIAFLPDGSRAYITNENDAAVSVIDVKKLEVSGTIPLGAGMKPMGIAVSKDGSTLYVTTGRGKKLFIISTVT